MAILDLLERIGLWNSSTPDEALSQNYRIYGAEMGFAGYDEFIRRANSFFDEAKAAIEGRKEGYTRVELSRKRVAFDLNSQIRGIYTPNGKPVAFFKPNYKTAGFTTPQEELEVFKRNAAVY